MVTLVQLAAPGGITLMQKPGVTTSRGRGDSNHNGWSKPPMVDLFSGCPPETCTDQNSLKSPSTYAEAIRRAHPQVGPFRRFSATTGRGTTGAAALLAQEHEGTNGTKTYEVRPPR